MWPLLNFWPHLDGGQLKISLMNAAAMEKTYCTRWEAESQRRPLVFDEQELLTTCGVGSTSLHADCQLFISAPWVASSRSVQLECHQNPHLSNKVSETACIAPLSRSKWRKAGLMALHDVTVGTIVCFARCCGLCGLCFCKLTQHFSLRVMKNLAASTWMTPAWNKQLSDCSFPGQLNRCNRHMLFNTTSVASSAAFLLLYTLSFALAKPSCPLPRKPALLHLTIFPREWRADQRQRGHLFQR